MALLTSEQLARLKATLGSNGHTRVAAIDVDFSPFDFARTGASLVDRAVAYSNPDGHQLVGIGTAWHVSGAGQTRFSDVGKAIRALPNADVKVFVGYAFHDDVSGEGLWSDFSAIDAFVPRISISNTDGATRLTVVVPSGEGVDTTMRFLATLRRPEPIPVVDPGDHSIESIPHVGRWAESVSDAVKAIASGHIDKVVLARSVRIDSTESVQILRVFRELASSYPECYNFAWKSGDSVFMGASPELLVRTDSGSFASNPLAGSARRGEGTREDNRIGDALLASAKDQEEHRLVVDDIAGRLDGLVQELVVPPGPELKKMATVQHLSTRMNGLTSNDPLTLVSVLHPTPAVGGVPRGAAVRYIGEAENIDRGWYSGGIGWVTPAGDGEIAIALRCGLVRDATTHLFAGAGIVADSIPADEVVETRLKLRPLMDIVAAT